MPLAILGLNHKTAPVSIREKIAFHPDAIDTALYSLMSHPLISGVVILSTCNRTEIYASFAEKAINSDMKLTIQNWLLSYHEHKDDIPDDSFYWYQGISACQHLMNVACGIDSMILGEVQILGQVRQAYQYSSQFKTLSSELNRLFQQTFFVAKKVRTETNIGSSSASIAYSTCVIVRELFPKKDDLTIMLVGAGEMNELIARYLANHKLKKVIIANRSMVKAKIISDRLQGEVITLSDISERLKEVDVVISSTASPLPIIGKGMVERSLAYRKTHLNDPKILFIDLAVPRDIEGEIAQLDDIHLYTIDNLKDIVSSNMEQRIKAVKNAEQIIFSESELFMKWLTSREAISYIKKYRKQAKMIEEKNLNKAYHQIEKGDPVEIVLRTLANRVKNQLIHDVTMALKYSAQENSKETFQLLINHLKLDD